MTPQLQGQLLQLLMLLCTLVTVPTTSALIGTTLSRVLAQDGFPKIVNALIAYIVLLAMAAASAYATNQLTGGLSAILDVIGAAASLLLSGALVSLKPYLLYLDFLQSNVFPIVKAEVAQDTNATNRMPAVAAASNAARYQQYQQQQKPPMTPQRVVPLGPDTTHQGG